MMWTQISSIAYALAVATGWKWPRRVEAWAWHKAWEARLCRTVEPEGGNDGR